MSSSSDRLPCEYSYLSINVFRFECVQNLLKLQEGEPKVSSPWPRQTSFILHTFIPGCLQRHDRCARCRHLWPSWLLLQTVTEYKHNLSVWAAALCLFYFLYNLLTKHWFYFIDNLFILQLNKHLQQLSWPVRHPGKNLYSLHCRELYDWFPSSLMFDGQIGSRHKQPVSVA